MVVRAGISVMEVSSPLLCASLEAEVILVRERLRCLEDTMQILEGNVCLHEDIRDISGSFVLPDAA